MSELWRNNSVIVKPIEVLKAYPNNPRKNEKSIDLVANSIKEFGFKVPIVIDSDNVIIAGHTRYEACKKIGLKEIPCIVANDLTQEQANAFRIADNKVAEYSIWDYEKLEKEIVNTAIDMSKFGVGDFLPDEIDLDKVLEESLKKGKVVTCPKCGKKVEI